MGLILEEKEDKIIGNKKWELIGNKSSGMTTWFSEVTTNMEFFKTAHRLKLKPASPCRHPMLLSSSDFHIHLPLSLLLHRSEGKGRVEESTHFVLFLHGRLASETKVFWSTSRHTALSLTASAKALKWLEYWSPRLLLIFAWQAN